MMWKLFLLAVIFCLGFTTSDAITEYKTCCAIQSACDSCKSLYKVNSITYCCPNCQGDVFVTALVCECTVVVRSPNWTPNCTVSNRIVGDYYYGRTSWYSAGNLSSVSAPALSIALCVAVLGIFRSAR